jgi:hypothetical protein
MDKMAYYNLFIEDCNMCLPDCEWCYELGAFVLKPIYIPNRYGILINGRKFANVHVAKRVLYEEKRDARKNAEAFSDDTRFPLAYLPIWPHYELIGTNWYQIR